MTLNEVRDTLILMRKEAHEEIDKLTAELEKLRADHDALGNDMDAVCVERDETREKLKQALEVNAELRADEARLVKERDEAQALCGEANRQRDGWRDEANRLEIKLSDVTRQLQRAEEVRRANTRPKPSRLEIAAMLMAHGWADRSMEQDEKLVVAALKTADVLIAAAKEVQK